MNGSPTYQELLAANKRLLAENELLRKENAKLNELVKSIVETAEETTREEANSGSKDPKPVFQDKKLTVTSCLSLEEKVTLFGSLFKGREDVFAKRWYSKASGKSNVLALGMVLMCGFSLKSHWRLLRHVNWVMQY